MADFNILPDEVLLVIISHLQDVRDLKVLQFVNRRVRDLTRDGQVWKILCFESSIVGRRHMRATLPKTIPPRQVQALQAEAIALQSLQEMTAQTRQQAKAEEMAKWDPSAQGESVDWFREYVARRALMHLRWAESKANRTEEDVDGLEIYKDSQGLHHGFLSFEDDSVGLWDLDSASPGLSKVTRTDSRILEKGDHSLYEGVEKDVNSTSFSTNSGCISIDATRHKAYVARDCQLNEIDLHTLQVSNHAALSRPISTLSNFPPGLPLIIGTSTGLHRYDPRCSSQNVNCDHTSYQERPIQDPGLLQMPQLSLSIVQPSTQDLGSGSSEIYAAGRYPSVLIYDQRTFPKIRHSIWSGATLSSLGLLPQLLPQLPQSHEKVATEGAVFDASFRGHTILAAGAKNGKGSLELYGVDRDTCSITGNIRNRTTASRVKLLSVIPHGRRICVSDADGNIKWFERDGFSLVRQLNINELAVGRNSYSGTSSPSSRGLFGVSKDNGDVVQSLIPVGNGENANLLLRAGSRAGLLGVGKDDLEEVEDAREDIDDNTARALRYEAEMRKALEASAMEARRIQNFGL